ncbi:MAG: hypothetical protein M1837_004464 [Sclerophora amabilis]|nr:MAG: hypothetical protein M1837_004464 [Sclerophora amabilis]
MIIYKDLLTGDEIISDTYKIKEVDEVIWEVDTKSVPLNDDLDINIGANASEDPNLPEEEKGLASGGGGGEQIETAYEIVKAFQLEDAGPYDKAMYKKHLKEYIERLKKHFIEHEDDKEKIRTFLAGAAKQSKRLLGIVGNCELFKGQTDDESSMRVLIDFREDGVTPYAIIWKHGLQEMKV